MEIREFAIGLTGREYGHELGKEEEQYAKELGFVIVFGYSDDNAEFRGAIDDEVGCYNGGNIYIDKNGVFEECECNCKHSKAAKQKTRVIKAIYGGHYESEYSWEYKTDIPHATFDIFEGDQKYCKGIVFDIKEL
ncbi:MAG: hypothetical protein RR782_02885 [Clostridium sp.]